MGILSNQIMALAGKMPIDVMISQLSSGMVETVKIFFLTLIFALPLGFIISFGRMSKITPLRWFCTIYISIMRGTPLMLQLIAIYYGPGFLFQTPQDEITSIIIAFSLNYAAYFAEIYRSGIESMPTGQYEAAQLLGYSRTKTFMKIILPQVIKRILPSVTNEIICLVKDTSLAFSIAYLEMFTITKQIAARETSMMPFVIAAVFYYVFNAVVAWVMNLFEKKLSYYK